ncbi:major vault protein [Crotalus adamanteus]|uniref:Major vault protein n=1 Tax=Crotalus adamanteus TaxID=8729 RepID=A0AAW1B0H7_CROAD
MWIILAPKKMVMVPPRHYCIILNPVVHETDGTVHLDALGQVRLAHADLEIRMAQDPFPLYPGEELKQLFGGPSAVRQLLCRPTAPSLRRPVSCSTAKGRHQEHKQACPRCWGSHPVLRPSAWSCWPIALSPEFLKPRIQPFSGCSAGPWLRAFGGPSAARWPRDAARNTSRLAHTAGEVIQRCTRQLAESRKHCTSRPLKRFGTLKNKPRSKNLVPSHLVYFFRALVTMARTEMGLEQ